MSRKRWRCFHCDAVLTTEKAAREHFGNPSRYDTPACQLLSGEGLIAYIRDLEDQLQAWRSDAHERQSYAFAVFTKASDLVPEAEQIGYDKGVAEALEMVRSKGFEPFPEAGDE